MKKSLFCSLLLTSLCVAAEPEPVPTCGDVPFARRLTLRHIEGNGVGYNQGYTTLEGFFAPETPWRENWLPFLDVRGHLFNNGKPAANAGLGVRYLGSRIWGVNAYYDYRKTSQQQYNQVSAGFESLGSVWDFRVNGYLPVSTTKSRYFDTKFDRFESHYMIISRKREFAMRGANAEVGYHLDTFKHAPLYFAAGPYYLRAEGKTAWGGELRAALDIFNYARIEGSTSYDNVFKWIGQGQVSINIPLGKQHKRGTSCTAARAYQRVDRNEIIPIERKHKYSPAINPATGDPFFFWFVDNTSHSLGTYESPFPSLLAAENVYSIGDVIYVFPGDGTSNGMNMGITLLDNQKLFGAGTKQTLTTTVGVVAIPPQANGMPLITNPGSNVIECGNNNEISGLNIPADTFTHAIDCLFINGVSVHNNFFALTNTSAGVFFTNPTGTVTITDNIFTLDNSNNDIGVSFFSLNLPATYVVTGNQFLGQAGGAGSLAISLPGFGPSGGTFNITQNQFTGCDGVIAGSPFTYTSSMTFNNNAMTNCGYGFFETVFFAFNGLAGSTLNAEVNGNVWQNSGTSVVSLGVLGEAANHGNVCLILKNNVSDLPLVLENIGIGTFTVDADKNVPNFEPVGSITQGTCP